MNVTLQIGDITAFGGCAIVNAANPEMLGGGGVDGAIHRSAGPRLREACAAFPLDENGVRCPIGIPRVTPGFNLPAKFVIHTVGPIYNMQRAGQLRPGETNNAIPLLEVGETREISDEEAHARLLVSLQLKDCYKRAILLATAMDLKSIAFPAISTGVYGYPHYEAAGVVCKEVLKKMVAQDWPLDVTLFFADHESFKVWQKMWDIFNPA